MVPRGVREAIHNSDRSVGTGLSGELMRRRAKDDGIDHEIAQAFSGSAGQSFGAFLADGVPLKLSGEANDYVCKGLSGGAISISPGAPASPPGGAFSGNPGFFGPASPHVVHAVSRRPPLL